MSDSVSKSWFCVFNNPADHGYDGEPDAVCERIVNEWMELHPAGAVAVAYCISAEGLHHLHVVLEDSKAMRFSAIKKAYPSMHIEPTKGNKEQAEDYIKKKGKFEEKGEQVICTAQRGDIKGAQGQRRDLGVIQDLIDRGMKPDQIMDLNINWRRYDKMIRDAYFAKRYKDTPFFRPLNVVWHVGDSGTGKTYSALKLREEFGEDEFYFVQDYDHAFDKYNGEKVLFLDEFRGQLRYSVLLSILQGYKGQVSARYSNVYGLWDHVHISTVFPPESVYKRMVSDDRSVDTLKQLLRRINKVIYHYKEDGEFKTFELDGENYISYEMLMYKAHADADGFVKVPDDAPAFGDI